MLNHYRLSRLNGQIRISEDSYDPAFEAKTESLFAQANGCLGVRAGFGLPSLYGKRETFCAGLFHRAYPEEVTELVNCPDLTAYRLKTARGELSPDGAYLQDFRRTFCPETGELEIRMGFLLPDGRILSVEERRFASFAEPDLFAQEIRIHAEKGFVEKAELILQANGQASNEGVSHFSAVTSRVFDRQMICLEGKLTEQTLRILCLNHVNEGSTEEPVFTLRRRGIEEGFGFSLEEGETLCVSRIVSFQTVRTEGAENQRDRLHAAAETGFSGLLDAHRTALGALWRRSGLKITGATEEEEAVIALSRYHLLAMMPWDRSDCSIASKGLTGEGYKGHVFWDTELFVQPFFTWFFPEQSRHMLEFRLRGLEGAREKAREYGYRGAMYPWEAASDGKEETPLFAALNIYTGKANPVWSGRKEHHVGADIVFALQQYLSWSGDRSFLREGGYEMLFSIADFWVSRAERDSSGRRCIRDIIGPDEYTEHIDNNTYTNYMASFCVQLACREAAAAQKEMPELCGKLGLKEKLQEWEVFLRELYLPEPDAEGIIPQDDTFLQKECISDLEQYRNAPVRQTILRDYSREEINELQVLKQADTVMLLNLFPGLFPPEVVKKNVLFYEERTIHDSSLSYCAHAQAMAAIGEKEMAWKYFRKSLEIDWNDNPMESVDGIHAASMGGIWNCMVQGFAGIRVADGMLVLDPQLPDRWEAMEMPLMIRGCPLKVRIDKKEVRITSEDGRAAGIAVSVRGRTEKLEKELRMPL